MPWSQVSQVRVPGTDNLNTRVVTALGQRLLIDALTGCPGSNSLLWFRSPASAFGVLGVVPFYSTENPALPL